MRHSNMITLRGTQRLHISCVEIIVSLFKNKHGTLKPKKQMELVEHINYMDDEIQPESMEHVVYKSNAILGLRYF